MSIFNKSNKKKIVLALACASILGDRTQAIKEPQSLQTAAAVGGATSRNNNPVQQGLSKKRKLAIVAAVVSLAAVTAIGFTIWGVKKYLDGKDGPSKKDNKDDNNKNNEDIEVTNEGDEKKLNEDSLNKKSLISSENSAEKNKMENLSKNLRFSMDMAFPDKRKKMYFIRQPIGIRLYNKLRTEKSKMVFEEITGDDLEFFTQDLFKNYNLSNYKIIYVLQYVKSEVREGEELQEGLYLSLKNETEINEQNISKICLFC
ncbi:MAG: hypothetical protein IJQ10_02795 [Clostridia bacterium]|nr:hypothetical protein [Clostridia bacterium]